MKRPLTGLLTLLLLSGTLHASTGISNRQYRKEVAGIIKADELDIVSYQNHPPTGTDAGAVALYVTLVEADLTLVQRGLTNFKHHKATREDVDRLLAQLSRDMEDAPEAALPETVTNPDRRAI